MSVSGPSDPTRPTLFPDPTHDSSSPIDSDELTLSSEALELPRSLDLLADAMPLEQRDVSFETATAPSIFDRFSGPSTGPPSLSFAIDPGLRLFSDFPVEQLTSVTAEMPRDQFSGELRRMFGDDIPDSAYGAFYDDLSRGTFAAPVVQVGRFGASGVRAAYDASEGAIQISRGAVEAAAEDGNAAWLLKASLAEELGHGIDHQLRHHYSSVGGDAGGDEGARFSGWLLRKEGPEGSGPFASVALEGRIAELSAPAGDRARGLAEAFDAGRISFDAKVGDKELAAEGGHYYTTYLVALRTGHSAAEARELAFYSQVPDEVSSADAIATQIQYLGNSAPLQRVVDALPGTQRGEAERNLTHGGIHSLTGGDAKFATEMARRAVLAHSDDNAAAGVAIHRLGDSFFHRRIEDESEMYSPGMGHFRHGFDGLEPDTLARRPALYREYVQLLTETLAERRGMTDRAARRALGEEVVRDLSQAAAVPTSMATEQDDGVLRRHAQAVLRDLLERESGRRVDRGESPLDLSFHPERHGLSHAHEALVGNLKTPQELLQEIYGDGGVPAAERDTYSAERIEQAVDLNRELYRRETGEP